MTHLYTLRIAFILFYVDVATATTMPRKVTVKTYTNVTLLQAKEITSDWRALNPHTAVVSTLTASL